MAGRGNLLLTHVIVAALGAGAAWLVAAGGDSAEALRLRKLEGELAELRRDAGDWQNVAESERERRELAEEDLLRLRQQHGDTGTPRDPVPMDPDDEVAPAVDPSTWDMTKLRTEMQRLARFGSRIPRVALFKAVVEAARANGDDAAKLLVDILSQPTLDAGLQTVAMLVVERLADASAVPPLIAKWGRSVERKDQRMTLRVLATLPGHEQVPVLHAVWVDRGADAGLRMIAIHGLARRGHVSGMEVVRGESPISTGPLRARAIESLHSYVRARDYADAELIDAFGVALLGADGDPQRRLALLALEGYWREACVVQLRRFGELPDVPDGPSKELRERALRAAGAIQRGDARPPDAGLARGPTSRGVRTE